MNATAHTTCTTCGTVHDSGIKETVTECPSCPETVRPLVSITLSAANLGTEETEAGFDAWAAYVASHIDDALDIDASVEQAAFTGRNATNEDAVSCDDEELRATVRSWLSHEGWDAFCSQAPAA